MIYNKGQKFSLDVVDDNPNQFIVDLNGKNVGVKKFEFQKGRPRPQRLQVIVDKADLLHVSLKQDMSPILAERYKPGEIHDFRVDADMTMTESPHYKVSEGQGYWIMLFPKPGIKLSKGDMVRCRIGRIQGINLNLEIVDASQSAFVKPLGFSDFYKAVPWRKVMRLVHFLVGRPELEKAREAYESKDYEWIFQALRGAKEVIFNMSLEDVNQEAIEHVATFRHMLSWLLEDSSYLNDFPNGRRLALRDELARTVGYVDDFHQALDIVVRGDQQKYIEEIFSKLRTSGYLYHPESKLRVLMCIVSLKGEMMDSHMSTLIDIIHEGKESVWKAEPFRTAFVNQLQLYIDTNHERFDLACDVDGAEQTERLDKMLMALAIQQLLRSNTIEDQDVDYTVNRSRLYRYFSFKKQKIVPRNMLDKAMHVLCGGTIRADEFGWKQTADTGQLSAQLLRIDDADGSTYRYDTQHARLTADSDTIEIKSPDEKAQHSALPQSLNLWSNLRLYLAEALPPDLRRPKTILQYKHTWQAINHAVFNRHPHAEPEPVAVKRAQVHTPELGDIVEVIIDGTDGQEVPTYHCTIVDDFYTGEGTVSIADLNGWRRALPMWVFNDARGNPYRFKAKVKSLDERKGTINFDINRCLLDFIVEQVKVNDIVRAVITAQPSARTNRRYSALTEFGYSVFVEQNDKGYVPTGSQVVLRVKDINTTSKFRGFITAEIAEDEDFDDDLIAEDLPKVEYETALHLLFQNYTDERTVESVAPGPVAEEAEAGGMEELLTDETAAEIMHIVARMGDVETDLLKSYNYFCFARLMAQMMGLDSKVAHYERRCRVIEILDEFASNGRVDAQELERLMPEIKGSDAMRPEIFKLNMLLALDRHEMDDRVWELRATAGQESLQRLANLVISYNALDGFKLVEMRRKIREQICSLLHLQGDINPTQIAGGMEDINTEFKTSMIYPAGAGMRRDVKAQINEILTVITGFMNSQGGRLYIGVSDEGYVRGLENDMEFFGTRDKMTLELTNNIHKHLTYVPNMLVYVKYNWENYDGREVLVVDVSPSVKPMALDNVYYERVGSSTFRVSDENVSEFLKQRAARILTPQQYEQPAMPIARPVEAEVEKPEHVAQQTASERRQNEVMKLMTRPDRDNRLHEYEFGPDEQQPVLFIYIDEDGSVTVSSTDSWLEEEKALTLALRDGETEQSLYVVYDSGSAVRVSVPILVNEGQGRFTGGDHLLFVAPVAHDDGLLLYFRGEDGVIVKQVFAPESIADGGLWEQGVRLLPKGAVPLKCLVVPAGKMAKFRQLQRNGQRVGRSDGDMTVDVKKTLQFIQ